MLKVWSFIILCYALVCCSDALDSGKCQVPPKEKHCLIEHEVKDRWPHQVRYVYNWSTKSCFVINWADHCPPVPSPPTSNNFASDRECNEECGGWA